jgi:signal transduction histidine kinase
MFDAVFLGYLCALIMLGLVFGAFSRDRGYVLYSLSLAGIVVSCGILSGHWAWLGLPGGDFMAKRGILLAGEFSAFMHVAFLRQLLGRIMPRVDRWAARVMWACAAATPALVAGPHRITLPILLGHHFLLGAALMGVALAAWRQGHRVARYYALAWMVFWVCFACSGILFLARQPLPHLVWVYTLVGTAASGTLFLVAMGDRVREIRGAALAAQAQLLAVERQAAEDLRRKLRQEQVLIRDLHDGIGGLTANLAILAEVGRRDAPAQPEQERFARISQLASDGASEVRSLMSSLEAREMSWPDFLDECRRHGQRALPPHGIAFDLAESGRPDAEGPDVFAGLSLLRVLKEALTNAVKHAGCTRVSVLAEFSPGRLRLTVRDNGRGLPSAPGHGRGLRNMDSRIRELGGTMTCRSESGLELVFELPLPVVLQATPAEGPA